VINRPGDLSLSSQMASFTIFTNGRILHDMPICKGLDVFMEPYILIDQSGKWISISDNLDQRNRIEALYTVCREQKVYCTENLKRWNDITESGKPRINLHEKIAINVFGSFYVFVVNGLSNCVYFRKRGSTVLEPTGGTINLKII
jgi:hypothetical protein